MGANSGANFERVARSSLFGGGHGLRGASEEASSLQARATELQYQPPGGLEF